MKKKPAHEELEKRVETLQSLLNAFSETAILIDLQGVILTISETAAQRLGRTVEEMIGTELVGHFPPDLASHRKTWGEEVVRTGKPVHFQDERDGRIYDTHDYPVFDPQGKVKAIAIYSRDITENVRVVQAMLDSEENFRSLKTSRDTDPGNVRNPDREERRSCIAGRADRGKNNVEGRAVGHRRHA